MSSIKSVELGDKVKDIVTGYTGIAIARTQWLQGCDRITIQASAKSDGSVPDSLSVDEPQIAIIKRGVAKPKAKRTTGGPMPVIKK